MSDDPRELLGNEQHFNSVVGSMIGSWNQVEDYLGHIFCALFGSVNNAHARAAYSAVVVFRTRLAMVHAAATVKLRDTPLIQEWLTLRKEADNQSKIRNDITHFSRLRVREEDGEHGDYDVIYALPSFWKPDAFTAALADDGKRYDANQIWGKGREFGILAIKLQSLAMKIEALWQAPTQASP